MSRISSTFIIIIIIITTTTTSTTTTTIKTYIWNPLITKWFFFLQLKSKNENA